jgi:hypothetical protein
MRDEDWQLLGLAEPTTDLLAIKRAYAVRLKRTRPDDDADAYQRLRQTYEWAQQWARWQAETAADEPASPPRPVEPIESREAERPTAAAALPIERPPAPETVETAPPPLNPEALVARAYQIWQQQGEAAFLTHWPTLHAGLDALPLTDMPEASARLAEMVIQVGDLPEAIVIELDRYFGWRADFRTARQIGPERAQALLRVLDDRIVRPISDPGVLEQLEPLLRVARLAAAKRKALALLHAVFCGGLLLGLYDALPARQWRALGYGAVEQVALRSLIGRAGGVRLGLGVLALASAMGLAGMSAPELVPVLVSGAIASLLLYFVAMWLTGILGGWFGLRWRDQGWAARLREWHAHPRRPIAGFAALGLSALAAGWASSTWAPNLLFWPWVPWFLLALAGTMALWPQDLRHGVVVVLAAGVGTFIAMGLLPAAAFNGPSEPAALSLGLGWALLASSAYERGWWGTREARSIAKPQAWPLAPVINSLALCDRWGVNFAMASVPLLVGLAMAGIVNATPWGLFVGWTLLVLGFAIGQEQLFGLGQRLAKRQGL